MRTTLIRQVLLLVGLAFLPAIGQAIYFGREVSWHQPPGDSALVSVTQARNWGRAVLWIDARPDTQFASSHISDAVQLNEDNWTELLPKVLAAWSPERKLVVYCSRQSCDASHEIAERLRKEAGLTNVYVLEGGWEEWQKSAR